MREELHQTTAELNAVKGVLKTERLKNSAAEVGSTILDGIGSMIGTSKVKRQEQEIRVLRQEVTARDEMIEILQTKIQTMQSDHSQELTAMQARHAAQTANLTKRHEKEMSLLKTALSKAVKWFPYFREMIRMESVCRTAGFNDKQTATLIKGKPLEYSGELYSEKHDYKFTDERVTAQIHPIRPTNENYNSISTKYRSRSGARRNSRNYEMPFANRKATKIQRAEILKPCFRKSQME